MGCKTCIEQGNFARIECEFCEHCGKEKILGDMTCENYEPKQVKKSLNIKELCDKIYGNGYIFCDGYSCDNCPLDYPRRGKILCET